MSEGSGANSRWRLAVILLLGVAMLVVPTMLEPEVVAQHLWSVEHVLRLPDWLRWLLVAGLLSLIVPAVRQGLLAGLERVGEGALLCQSTGEPVGQRPQPLS